MAEIAITDLSAATRARFVDDDAAQAALDAVLAAARRYCGWHVSPVIEDDEQTLDGPGGQVLDLPTRKLIEPTEIIEGGTTLNVNRLDWSKNGSVRKQSGSCWSSRYRSIVATFTHGYTEAEAIEWRRAIIAMVDSVSRQSIGTGGDEGLKRKKVDDVEYEWFDLASASSVAITSVASVLDSLRLPEVLFV